MAQKIKTFKEAGQPAPRFKEGDKVIMPPDLYGYTEAVVDSTERVYKALDRHIGGFDDHGLCTLESHAGQGQLPSTFDGVTLTVDYPADEWCKAKTQISKFWGWSVRVKTEKLNTIIPERYLKLKK